jgi:hypothetical protein
MGVKGIEPTPCNLTSTGQTTKPPIPFHKYSHLFTFVLFPADIYLGKTRRPPPHRAPGSLTPSPFPRHAPGADAAGSSPTPFPTRLLELDNTPLCPRLLEPDAAGRRLPLPAGGCHRQLDPTPPAVAPPRPMGSTLAGCSSRPLGFTGTMLGTPPGARCHQ